MMIYRVITNFLFVLPIVAFLNDTMLVACTFIYTILSIGYLFQTSMILAFYTMICHKNGFSMKNVFSNIFYVIIFIVSLALTILGGFLINMYSRLDILYTERYRIHILVLSNFYTALNIYYLFTNFTYHKNIWVPDAFAFHVNFKFNKEITHFSDICYKTPY